MPDPDAQRRIAAVLDAVDDAIAKIEAVIEKLRLNRLGMLDSLLAPVVRAGDPPPRGWRACALGDLLDSTEYGISSSLTDRGGVPVLRMNNFAEGEAVVDEIRFASAFVPPALLVKVGDVLFNRTVVYERERQNDQERNQGRRVRASLHRGPSR